jgi:hypothetical protein
MYIQALGKVSYFHPNAFIGFIRIDNHSRLEIPVRDRIIIQNSVCYNI